jgi:sugar phosphate isomerase/epimerase
MALKPVAVQLYSLRERSKKDFEGAIKAVAEIGYLGVEPAGLFGMKAVEFRRVVEDLGMVISSNHQPWPNRENLNEVKDTAFALGSELVICGFRPEDFRDEKSIRETAETIAYITEELENDGLSLALHNHYWEFEELDGRLKYDILLDQCPGLLCEMDVYWAANFGTVNPIEQLSKHKSRTVLLHLKDGSLEKGKPLMPLGAGKMDIPAVIEATDPDTLKWIIVELDNCEGKMEEALRESFNYLTANEMGQGR